MKQVACHSSFLLLLSEARLSTMVFQEHLKGEIASEAKLMEKVKNEKMEIKHMGTVDILDIYI